MNPSPFRQIRLDEARIRRLTSFSEKFGLCEEDERELAGLLRRVKWLEQQLASAQESGSQQVA